MHSHLWELCDHLRAAGIGITILSTGLLLRRHAAELVRRCDDVVVSLDGPQRDPQPDPQHPARLREAGRGRGGGQSRRPARGWSARAARSSAPTSATCAPPSPPRTSLGLDRISFLAADVSSEAFNRPGGWDERARRPGGAGAGRPAAAGGRDRRAGAASARPISRSGYIAESPLKLRRRLSQYYAALLGQGDFFPNDVQRALGFERDRVRRHGAAMLLSAAARQHLPGRQPGRDPEFARGDRLAARARSAARRDLPEVCVYLIVAGG